MIPNHAKRVFKGIIFDVYHWKQKMFDGSYATFEALKRPDTVQVIPTIKGKVLIAEEKQPNKPKQLNLFGGRIEPLETPLNCAKRELLEETGFKSNDWELLRTYKPYYKIDWKIYFYAARNCEKVQSPNLDPGEKIKVKKVSFEKFIKLTSDGKLEANEFTSDVLRMRLNGKVEAFRKKLLG